MAVITSIEDLRVLAQRRVPRMFYDYVDSGSWTGSDDLTLYRLFLSSIRNDDAAHSLPFGIEATDHHPIVQRTKFHWILTNLVPADEGWSTCPMSCLNASGADFLAFSSWEC